MERIINYTLSADSISPDEPLCGGIQGEHRATALVFTPDAELQAAVQKAEEEGSKVTCKIDFVTDSGEYFKGEERELSGISDPFYLTSAMTASGLDSAVVFRLMVKEGELHRELYKAQIKLYFETSPVLPLIVADKKSEAEKLYEAANEVYSVIDQKTARVNELMAVKLAAVSDKVAQAAGQLKRVTLLARQMEETRSTLEEGTEFVFCGGDATDSAEAEILAMVASAVKSAILSSHPVGSLYWSSEATDPSELFGGSWERVKDKFILAAGDSYEAGAIGGEATHLLTIAELPKHNHTSNGGALFWNSEYGNIGGTTGKTIVSASTLNNNGVATGDAVVGSSVPHNNMPPYEAYYCWKRIA